LPISILNLKVSGFDNLLYNENFNKFKECDATKKVGENCFSPQQKFITNTKSCSGKLEQLLNIM